MAIILENIILERVKISDLPILYQITQDAMSEVNLFFKNTVFSEDQKVKHYKEYSKEMSPQIDNTWLIKLEKQNIGRLRIVRENNSIFIAGIQILPKFQSQGIGGFIMDVLIKESKKNKVPIGLKVHKINQKAIKFYLKYNFKIISKNETQFEMEFKF